MHLFLCKNDDPWFLISCSSYIPHQNAYIIGYWKLTANTYYLSCVTKRQQVVKHSEMSHRKMYCRSLLVEVVQQCFDKQKLSLFDSLLASFKLLRIALLCRRCEFVQLAYCEEKTKCQLEFYSILHVTIENLCSQITPGAKFAIRLAIDKSLQTS